MGVFWGCAWVSVKISESCTCTLWWLKWFPPFWCQTSHFACVPNSVFLRVYFHYEDPSFVTPNPSCSSLSSVSFPFCIVDKCLSISASSVVVNRLHGVLALQKACQVCVRCESLFYCAEAFSSCSPPLTLPHSGWGCMCFRALSTLYLEITLHFAVNP